MLDLTNSSLAWRKVDFVFLKLRSVSFGEHFSPTPPGDPGMSFLEQFRGFPGFPQGQAGFAPRFPGLAR